MGAKHAQKYRKRIQDSRETVSYTHLDVYKRQTVHYVDSTL